MLSNSCFCQKIDKQLEVKRFLIGNKEIDTSIIKNIDGYYFEKSLLKCKVKGKGIYEIIEFGVNSPHGKKFLMLVKNEEIEYLTNSVEIDIEKLFEFIQNCNLKEMNIIILQEFIDSKRKYNFK